MEASRAAAAADPNASASAEKNAGTLPDGSWKIALTRAGHGFMKHRGIDAAAALTFFTALATFPALLVLVSAFAFFDNRDAAVNDLVAIVNTVLPGDAARDLDGLFREMLSLENPGIALAAGLILLVWTVSGYSTAFGRVVNTVYEVEEGRQFWNFRGRMILVALVLIVLGTVIATILLTTPQATESILGRRGVAPLATIVWNVGKWPLLLAVVAMYISVLYYATPNVRHTRVRWATIGSFAAIALWAVGTVLFAVYIIVAGHYDTLYGSLGGLVTALLWAYLSNAALVGGAEIDAEFVRLRQLARGESAEETVRLPLRDTSRNLMLARQHDADVAAALKIKNSVADESA